jgi:fructokinase
MPSAPRSVPPAVLVVGECLVDLAPAPAAAAPAEGDHGLTGPQAGMRFVALPGGGPANVAVGLARLGAPAEFAGRFSSTGFGPWLRHNLERNGVGLGLSVEAPQAATLAVVTLDPRGRASYTFYGPETADWQWSYDELPGSTGPSLPELGVAAVHTGSLVASFQPGASAIAAWLAELRRRGETLISFDPNVRAGLATDEAAYRRELEAMIVSSHVVKASEEDVAAVYPGRPVPAVARGWLDAGVHLAVVTEGERGATAYHANGQVARLSPPAVQVVDTIGAGDAFSSGFLAFLAGAGLLSPAGVANLEGRQLELALSQAVAVSALTCTKPGADPPTAAELAELSRA